MRNNNSPSALNLRFEGFNHIASSEQTHRRSSRSSPPQDRASDFPRTQFNEGQMRLLRQRGLMKMIIKKMHAMVPMQQPSSKVHQQWEAREGEEDQKAPDECRSFDQKVFLKYPLYQFLSFLQGLSVILFLWALSTSLVFQMSMLSSGCLLIIIIEAVNTAIKILMIALDHKLLPYLWKSIHKQVISPICVVAGCLLMLHVESAHNELGLAVDISMGIILFIVGTNTFQSFQAAKMYAQKQKFIKEMRIVQLFCLLFLLAHCFGLILYSTTYSTPGDSISWVSTIPELNIPGKPVIIRYIYSVYWAMTTIITVGYGDITPQNYVEVLVVIMVEICGASFYGYMISVMGGLVDKKNLKNEEYDNDQEIITKLKDHYQLSQQLCRKMRANIKAKYNQAKAPPLKKVEETQFLDNVDPLVKKDFIHETNIRIIKKSIFFLTYFTVHFQNEVALKLVRAIYKQDDPMFLLDPQTKERRLIIINHGRINLFIERKHNNISCKKLVKTIETIEGKPTLNVYGYSSLILDRDIALLANAQTLTSAYELRLSDLHQIMARSMVDYETFHEMREKMLLQPIKQSIEAPILKDYCFHYTPNVFILSKKENKKFYQERTRRNRTHARRRLELIDVVAFINFKGKMTKKVDEDMPQIYKRLKSKKSKDCAEFQSLLSIEQDGNSEAGQTSEVAEIHDKMEVNIDQIKIFDNFMRAHNINRISAKYEESCRTQSFKKRILTSLIIRQ